MIPKKIHYMWFGGSPLPESAKKYMDSWRKFCPDYEIVRWDESNFDIHCCKYVEEAYQARKWAFVSDYARFWVLFNVGGIYFDTDIEVVRSMNSLLEHKAFFGFGSTGLSLPVFGAQAGQPSYKDIVEDYNSRSFVLENGKLDLSPIDLTALRILKSNYGLIVNNQFQTLNDGTVIYPKQYFHAFNTETGVMNLYPELFVIHYADGSWLNDNQKYYIRLKKKCAKLLGGGKLSRSIAGIIYYYKTEGLFSMIKKCVTFLLRI